MRCSTHWSRTPAAATTPDRPGPPRCPLPAPMIAPGISVSGTAPASFRYTYPAGPERHLHAAELLGADVRGVAELEGRERLPMALVGLMRDIGMPNGLEALGYAG